MRLLFLLVTYSYSTLVLTTRSVADGDGVPWNDVILRDRTCCARWGTKQNNRKFREWRER